MPLVVLFLAAVAATAWVVNRQSRERQRAERRATWGQPRQRDRDMAAIGAYHRTVAEVSGPDRSIDDRTWEDLTLDDVFAVIDRTESVVGQQALYHRLRSTPCVPESLDAFEALVGRFEHDQPAREAAQAALAGLRGTAGYDLWWLAQPGAVEAAAWHVIFPLMTIAMIASLALVVLSRSALPLVAAIFAANLVLRGLSAKQLRVAVAAFQQVAPLLGAAQRLSTLREPAAARLIETLAADTAALSRLRSFARWVGLSGGGGMAGELGASLLEYLNLFFCLDANALLLGGRELRAHGPALLRVVVAVGEIDAAQSIASYRAGTTGWTRPSLRPPGAPATLTGLRHPLLADAVPNSLTLAPPFGLIVTGSNMSGKSTFLRTVGVTVVLAQTIHTCVADAYDAPVFSVRSCIGRADDPATGRSYYLVEVDSVLALVQDAARPDAHLFLFDELFRGTNAVERIAAGEAVLATLVGAGPNRPASRHVVIAATHDRELVDRLAPDYVPCHFTDGIDADGLRFDYQLRPGPSTTRNAIALLKARHAPADLVARAYARAEELDRQGR